MTISVTILDVNLVLNQFKKSKKWHNFYQLYDGKLRPQLDDLKLLTSTRPQFQIFIHQLQGEMVHVEQGQPRLLRQRGSFQAKGTRSHPPQRRPTRRTSRASGTARPWRAEPGERVSGIDPIKPLLGMTEWRSTKCSYIRFCVKKFAHLRWLIFDVQKTNKKLQNIEQLLYPWQISSIY